MHNLTEKELQYQLEDIEVIDLVVSIANDLTNKGHFKGFLVEIEDLPYWDGAGDYVLLEVKVQSDIVTELLGDPNNSDTVIVDKTSRDTEGFQQLIERGNVLVGLLKAAVPDAVIKTKFPKIEVPVPEKPAYPEGSMHIVYKQQENYFNAIVPTQAIADKVIEVLQEQGCEIVCCTPANKKEL